jgi:hypothetical protein
MINETSTQWSEKCSDIMQCFHSPKQPERNTNRGVMCCAKKEGYTGLLQACATSRRVLVVANTYNKLPRPRSVNTSIHSVKGEKQQEMQ